MIALDKSNYRGANWKFRSKVKVKVKVTGK